MKSVNRNTKLILFSLLMAVCLWFISCKSTDTNVSETESTIQEEVDALAADTEEEQVEEIAAEEVAEEPVEEIEYEDFSDDFFDDGVFGDEGYESLLDDYVEKPKSKKTSKSPKSQNKPNSLK